MASFPWQSPYCAFDNNPVFFVDPLGLAAENGGDKGKGKKKRSDKLYDNADKSADKWIKHNEEKGTINKGAEKYKNSKGDVDVIYTKTNSKGEITGHSAKFRQKQISKSPEVKTAGALKLQPWVELTIIKGGIDEGKRQLGSAALKTAGLTVGFVLISHSGHYPENEMDQYQFHVPKSDLEKLQKREKDDGKITLYRGVNAKHRFINKARVGIAIPIGLINGHNDPAKHNDGNTNSIFTSWTLDKETASKWATVNGAGGVILEKQFSKGEYLPSPDAFNEKEFLVPGIVTGAKVRKPGR
jgi:hypothetical protein